MFLHSFIPMTLLQDDRCLAQTQASFEAAVQGDPGIQGNPGTRGLSEEEISKVLAEMETIFWNSVDNENRKRANTKQRISFCLRCICFAYSFCFGLYLAHILL